MNVIRAQQMMMAAGSPVAGTVTWNPADSGGELTLSNGDLTVTYTNSIYNYGTSRATFAYASGKHYFEVHQDTTGASNFGLIGVCLATASLDKFVGSSTDGWSYYEQTGAKVYANALTSYGLGYAGGDVIGIAVDMDAGKVWWSLNGTFQASGDPAAGTNEAFSGLSGAMYPAVSIGYTNGGVVTGRFKTADFSYSPPSGFSAWGT